MSRAHIKTSQQRRYGKGKVKAAYPMDPRLRRTFRGIRSRRVAVALYEPMRERLGNVRRMQGSYERADRA